MVFSVPSVASVFSPGLCGWEVHRHVRRSAENVNVLYYMYRYTRPTDFLPFTCALNVMYLLSVNPVIFIPSRHVLASSLVLVFRILLQIRTRGFV